ncbi:MAG: protease HtpX, partial [Armatimonadetes bacterium CG_4_10_14_3_um_filter_59_10]
MGNALKTGFLMIAMTALLVFIGEQFGGVNGMMGMLIFAVLMNFGSLWFSDKIVLAMYHAKEVGPHEVPELYGIVQRLTTQAGMPMPKVYIIPTDSPNAFATGRSPRHAAVAATEGIMHLLTRDELEGVIAHELAHVKNRDTLISAVAATMAGVIMMVSRLAFFFGGSSDDNRGGNPLGLLLAMIVGPIAAMLIQMAISRSREYAADAGGAAICGRPLSLANALSKLESGAARHPLPATPATSHMFIVNPLRGGGIAGLFMTHPPIPERVAR